MTIAAPSPSSLAEELNRAVRRVFLAGQQAEWTSAVLDAALPFCADVSLLSVQGLQVQVERASFAEQASGLKFDTAAAPAIAQTLATLEPAASAWTPRELSAGLAGQLLSAPGTRAYLFPVIAEKRGIGVLLAAGRQGQTVDVNGLELVATVAGAAWELARRRNQPAAGASTGLIALASQQPGTPGVAAREEDSEWHRRARRFASVRVAELRLYQAARVSEGRQARNLYDLFRETIDHERATFQVQFMEKSPSMVDYLHEELVRTLAQGEPDRLGETYPGAMVHR